MTINIVEVFAKFPTQKDCIAYLERVRWQGKPVCPYCSSQKVSIIKEENRYHCNNCNTSFSVTVGTIFHDTRLPLQKWFLALTLILNTKKGMSARQLARDLDVNKNTGWYLAMRIRKAMTQSGERELLLGVVEMDETYIGGKPRKGDKNNKNNKRGRGTKKTPVVGMVARGGKIKAEVIKNKKLSSKTLSSLVRKNVDTKNAVLFTDECKGYIGISTFMEHKTINHQKWYVDGDIHTNSIESFWALLKRGIVGQYHKVSVGYLHHYIIDEFSYRFNNRENDDLFAFTIARAVGA